MILENEQIISIYENARNYFVSIHPEWLCTIEEDILIIQLNWQNSTFFNGRGLSHFDRTYRHIIKVFPDGKFMTTDLNVTDETAVGVGIINISQQVFSGKSWNYHYEKEFGRDNNTGEVGILTYKFNTSDIQKPVKEYFKSIGLQYKAISFGESLKAVPAQTKIMLGVLFSFIGLVFVFTEYFVLYMNPNLKMNVVVDGVPQVMYVSQIPIWVKAALGIFPVVFILVGIMLIVNFIKYNVSRN